MDTFSTRKWRDTCGWGSRLFRTPDVDAYNPAATYGYAVWYGPGGKESEDCTEVEVTASRATVREYHWHRGEYLVQETSVRLPRGDWDPRVLVRYAATVGTCRIGYEGGTDSTADELPQ